MISAEGISGTVALALADGASAPVSALAEGRFRYNTGANRLEFSENTSPWTPFSALAGYWGQTGTVIHPITLTDEVVVGASAVVGTEQFRVVGSTRLQGDVTFETGAVSRNINVDQAAADTQGTNLRLFAGVAGDMAGATRRDGGRAVLDGGGGANANTAASAGFGGNVELEGGVGGSNSGAGVGGDGGNITILGGAGGLGTGNGANGSVNIGTSHTSVINVGNVSGSPPTNFIGTGAVTFGGHQALAEQSGDPGATANQGKLYTKDDGGVTELFYQDSGGTVTQLTPTGSAGPWDETGGVVSTDNTSWDVVVGAAAMSGVNSEKFRVVGDCSFSDDIFFETEDGGLHNIQVNQSTAGVNVAGDRLYVNAGQSGDSTAQTGTGGSGRFYGGAGGTNTGTTHNAGQGGTMSVQGGQGGWQNGVGTASPIRGGSGGLCSLRGGTGGTPGTSNSADGGFGGRAFVAGGPGGNSPFGNTGTAGDGGDLELYGGSAGIALGGTGTHGNGGDAYLRGGDRLSGTGNNGSIFIADAHTAAITIGNATDNPPTSFLGTGAVTFGGHQALVEQSGDPGATANQGKFYTKDDSGVTQLFYRDSGGTVYQLTPTGQASSTSVQSASVYTCPAGLVVGDAVQITGADAVDKADASVPADRPVVGFVKSKPTATTCILHYYGELSAFGGLSVGSTYYLSDSTPGAITTTAPNAIGSIVQEIGFARNSTTLVVFIDPDYTTL